MRNKNVFDLHWQRQQHNEEAGMRKHDLHWQRQQQRTVGLALAGLEKGGLFVLKKTVVFAFIKAVWFALRKVGLFALRKAFCSPLERRFVRFEKSGFFPFLKR
jgi:hypothetical protein